MAERTQSGPTASGQALAILRRHPDRTAFSWDGGRCSRAAVLDLVGRFQTVLAARGLRGGDRVGLLAANTAESWCAGLAVQASGMAASWLHPAGSLPDQLHQLADLGAAACVVDLRTHPGRAVELADGVRRAAPDVAVIGLGGDDVGVDLLTAAHAADATTAVDRADPDDLAQINYTGGTTGRAKGAVRRQSGLAMMPVGVAADFAIPIGGCYLAVAPNSHVGGSKVLPVLARGGSVHLQQGFDPERVLAAISRERVAITLAVPTMVYALLDAPGLDRADLSSLETLLYGAAPMSPTRLAEGIERIGPVFSQLYGQTECYPISVLPAADHADPALAGSCGFPVTTVSVALLDDDGAPVAPGERGELCVRGPGVMDGYWRRPDLTAEALCHGWLHTGDVAREDERGALTIVDRTKDMIISGGFNVFPSEVEAALTSHPGVSAAAVYGVPDDHWGEAVTAAVVLRDGHAPDPGELARHVRELKGAVQTPKTITVLDALPVTPLGKVDKQALRAR